MESVYADMSESEKEVALYLQELGLYWKYESPIFVYDEKGRPRVWTPDFYIPKLGMHVEVWSSAERDHSYREEIYKRNDYNVIFVHAYRHHKDWKRFLVKRIMAIEEQRHDEVMKMLSTRIT